MTSVSKAALLDELRRRIRRIEGIGGADGSRILPFGIPAVDQALPDGGLPLSCLHELASGEEDRFGGAATGFAAALLARIAARHGPTVWITRGRDLYAPGLTAFGLTPERLIVVRAERDPDVLWAMEEVLGCPRIGAVLGEAGSLDLTASRRLQLAAEAGGVTGFLLRIGRNRTPAGAAVTRWLLTSASSVPAANELGVGRTRWHARLQRCRGGTPGEWLLEWHDNGFDAVEMVMPFASGWPTPAVLERRA
jgi:protein ImuA